MSKFSTALAATKTFAKAPIKNPTTGKLILKLNQQAPNILVYSGIVGMVGTTVLACKEIFEVQHDHFMASGERIKMKNFVEKNPDSEEADSYKKDLTKSYLTEVGKHIKTLTPALTLGALSIASIMAGHNMLRKRHVAIVGAYAALQESYNDYREAVTEKLGEEEEYKLRADLAEKKAGTKKVDPNKPVSEQVKNSAFSPYAKCFDESNPNWMGDAIYNTAFLRNQQNFFNDKLSVNGYVLLSDVYKALGFNPSRAAYQVGWVLGNGDSFIDFGVWDENNQKAKDFVNGYEKAIWLDFNVDGPILDVISVEEF